jgi:hypothetical protein
LYGTGNFTYGYFGGMLDAATGLLYVGNGQYYDPATGRFLTRNVNPDSTNPYVPWNPIGAIVGPLGLIALVFGRRKKGSKAGTLLVLLLIIMTVSMTLVACGGGEGNGQQEDQSLPAVPNTSANQNSVDTGPGTNTGSGISSSGSGIGTPTITCTFTPFPTSTSTPIPTPTPTSTSTPTPINCDGISDIRARNACRTYLALRDHSGWWNGNQPGNLTPQAFAGLLLRMEFSDSGGTGFNLVDHSIQQETVVRKFYSHCYAWQDSKCDSREAKDMFIFIGTQQLLEIGGRVYLKMNPTDTSTIIAAKWKFDPAWSTADFESVFLNPPGSWRGVGPQEWVTDQRAPTGQSFVYTAPLDWGNISMYKHYDEAMRLLRDHWKNSEGLAEWQFYIRRGGGNTATIVTLSQRNYWNR